MNYPTVDQVAAADHEQIARWFRFLPSPGARAVDTPEFQEAMSREVDVMKAILARLQELGGMTPEISKRIGPPPRRCKVAR